MFTRYIPFHQIFSEINSLTNCRKYENSLTNKHRSTKNFVSKVCTKSAKRKINRKEKRRAKKCKREMKLTMQIENGNSFIHQNTQISNDITNPMKWKKKQRMHKCL